MSQKSQEFQEVDTDSPVGSLVYEAQALIRFAQVLKDIPTPVARRVITTLAAYFQEQEDQETEDLEVQEPEPEPEIEPASKAVAPRRGRPRLYSEEEKKAMRAAYQRAYRARQKAASEQTK